MPSNSYQESFDELSSYTRDMHRAINSLREELEAIDYYQQRADVTEDEALKRILEHNRDEEIEHAVMLFEWLRRKNPVFAEECSNFLMKEGDITELEEIG